MIFDYDTAIQLKDIIEKNTIHNIITYCQKSYPNEACGFVLESGAIHPAQNIIDTLYDRSLTARDAFMIDAIGWEAANNRESPIVSIFHSHTNGDCNMSETDMAYLKWHDLCYIIVGIIDYNPVSAKMFWWNTEHKLQELIIKI